MRKKSNLRVDTPEPFNFEESLVYLNRSLLEKLHFVQGNTLTKLVSYNDKKILVRISPDDNCLAVNFLNCNPSFAEREFVKQFIYEWFDFAVDLNAFYKALVKGSPFDRFKNDYSGLRMVKIHSLFQALCWAIIGQQVNITFAYTLFGRFIESFGSSMIFDENNFWLFPEPRIIAELKPDDLRELQFTRMKAEYIIQIAALITNGELSKESLVKDTNFSVAKKLLIDIRGIGPWTANYVLMRCLGAPDSFPIEDVGLHNALKIELGLETKPDIETVKQIAQSVPGWGSYLAFYLYRSLL